MQRTEKILALALSEGCVAKAHFSLKNSHLLHKDGLLLMLSTYSNTHLLKGFAEHFFMGPGTFLIAWKVIEVLCFRVFRGHL